MSNLFNLRTDLTPVQTVVDAIRAVDVPAITADIATVDTVVDLIRSDDFPAAGAALAAIDALCVTIDTEVDAIRSVDVPALTAEIAAVKPRGKLKYAGGVHIWNGYQDLLPITGSGKVLVLGGSQETGAGLLRLTLDGTVWTSGLIAAEASYFGVGRLGDTVALICDPADPYEFINIEFDTSLLLEGNSQSGVNGLAWHIIYIET